MNDFDPPYYAVIFTSTLKANAIGYEAMAKSMVELAKNNQDFWALILFVTAWALPLVTGKP